MPPTPLEASLEHVPGNDLLLPALPLFSGERWSDLRRLVNSLGTVMPSPFLYAELLSNIRQVTLYASLESYKNEETKIQLSSDRKSVSLSHDGELATMLLPNEIAGTAQLTMPAHRAKELSFRLQIAEAIEPTRTITASDNEVPWSANTLREVAQIRCRACENQIIDSFIIYSWKDLPSEHWAEMMDFWHCHKPHDHKNHNGEEIAGKGYGASTKVTAESGVGLVDISSFLLAEEDCHGVQVSSRPPFSLCLSPSQFISVRFSFRSYMGTKKETLSRVNHRSNDSVADTTVLD